MSDAGGFPCDGRRPRTTVEPATLFEPVLNLRTAKTLRLATPDSFVARIDRVIE